MHRNFSLFHSGGKSPYYRGKIWIVPIVLILVGGILFWQYFEVPKEEVKTPKVKAPEEKVVSEEGIPEEMKKEIDKCKELSEKESQDRCYYDFGIETGKKGSCELCERIPNVIAKRYCILKVTATSEDYVFCEGLDINIEDFFKKYTDEVFGFSFYYPKGYEIKVSKYRILIESDTTSVYFEMVKSPIEGKYLFSSFYPAGPVPPPWTSYIYYDENKEKYVKYVFDVEEGSEKDMIFWRKVTDREVAVRDGKQAETKMPPLGHILREPNFYTVSDLSVFNQSVRFGHYNIVCLYPNRFLSISTELTGTPVSILDAFTKTIVRTDQNIEDRKIKKALIEEFLSFQMYPTSNL